MDRLVDAHAAVFPLGPRLGFHGRRIGKFAVELEEELLAGDFRREQALRHVRRLVGRIMPLPGGHGGDEGVAQFAHAVAGQGGDHEGFGDEGAAAGVAEGGESGSQLQQSAAVDEVDLVQHDRHRPPQRRRSVDDELRPVVDAAPRIDHQRHRVGAPRALPGGAHHRAVEAAARREHPRGVHEHDLRRAADGDAEHPVAGGLRFRGDDGNLGSDQAVEERGLAGVGRAEEGDETAALRFPAGGRGGVRRRHRRARRRGEPLPRLAASVRRRGDIGEHPVRRTVVLRMPEHPLHRIEPGTPGA